MAEKPTQQEIVDIEFDIKKIVRESGLTMAEMVQKLNEKYDMNETAPAMSRHFKAGNIPLWKVKRIADLLGYALKIERK